jgi:predicted homoserine dehydrogenase-like protein
MHIVDTALAKRAEEKNPIRVGLVGAGFMSRGLVHQIVNFVPGIRVAAIYNRTLSRAAEAFAFADESLVAVTATNQNDFNAAVSSGKPVVTDDPFLLTGCDQLELLVDLTGAVELGAQVALDAVKHKKHVILMNAELDATVGPVLKTYADKAGVIISACDGDQPGVQINLARFVKGLGLIPRVLGNIKGLQDEYRNPTTQAGFAAQWGQNPAMVTSFADGSKVSFEQTIVANALGLTVHKRGMLGQDHDGHVDELTTKYDVDELRELGGVVDYVVKAKPGPGVYCIAEHTDPKQRHYLNLFKLGEGPLYSFYTPYHLCHLEVPNTIARVIDFADAGGVPLGAPTVEVCAVAKRPLKAGEVLDDYGHYMTYGQAVSAKEMQASRYLPEGIVEGCVLKRDLPIDAVLTYDDIELPSGRLIDSLLEEQRKIFPI